MIIYTQVKYREDDLLAARPMMWMWVDVEADAVVVLDAADSGSAA